MMNDLAPIALFVYARPDHTKRTIHALSKNELAADSHLFIFSDAARSDKDIKAVNQVREYISQVIGFKKVTIIIRKTNKGLADSIIEGVTELINQFGKVIVLEDDLVTSPFFLCYMNDALQKYYDNDQVMHIAAYIPPIKHDDLPETFFLRQSSCWGWATWDRAWNFFSRDGSRFIQSFKPEDIELFNLDGAYDYWNQLTANEEGRLKTWAVFWYASVFSRGGLCLHPRESLVENIGFDGSGENCGTFKSNYNLLNPSLNNKYQDFSSVFKENVVAKKRIKEYLYELNNDKRRNKKQISMSLSILKRIIFFSEQLSKSIFFKGSIHRIMFLILKIKGFSSYPINKKLPQCCQISSSAVLHQTATIRNLHRNQNSIRIGDFTHIRGDLATFWHGGEIKIGEYCYIGEGTHIWSAKLIDIGDRVLIAHNVNIFDNDTHPIDDYEERHRQFMDIVNGNPIGYNLNESEVIIEDDVLIATQSVILSGVRIGRGSVVGAGSVVTKNVPPNTLVAGNPAKIVRNLNKQ